MEIDRTRNKILFLLSHQPNPRFIKQINYLSVVADVSVCYYFRDYMKDLASEYNENCIFNESIGSITNGNYIQRISKYIKSIKKLHKILQNNHYDVLMINNIDTLALFKVCTLLQKNKTKIIIEISDLRAHTYLNTIKSSIIRFIEKLMFKYIDKLIVTSPKFYDLYYDKLFKKEYFLLENKPLSNMIPKKLNKIENKKVIIGIVGLLLQGKPYKALFETLKNDKKCEIHVYGKGTFQALVEEYADKYENIKYFGEYNFFKDSAKIYASLDMLYMPYDTTNESLNNKVALPNKFYEAMYFNVPVITSKGTYLGELIEEYAIGITVKCCKEKEIKNAIENIIKNKKLLCKRFKNLPKEIYFADNDYVKLEKYIFREGIE